MINLKQAKFVGVHPAPDLDAVGSVALACMACPSLYQKPIVFIPAGEKTPQEIQQLKQRRIVCFDVAGHLGDFDHHGSERKVSSCRLTAEKLRVLGRYMGKLLTLVDKNDRKGENFRLKIVVNGNEMAADDLLFTSIIRASSQIVHNPFKVGVSEKDRAAAFWKLVRKARILIARAIEPDFEQAPLSRAAGYLLRLSLCQAIAKTLSITQPKFLTKLEHGNRFTATLGELNAFFREDGDQDDQYLCQEDPMFVDLIRMMINFPPKLHFYKGSELIRDSEEERFLINLSILGLAQALVENNKMKQPEKLSMLKDCWLLIIFRKQDWLLANSHLKNGNVVGRKDVGKYHIVTVRSDCAQMGPATRHVCNGDPKTALNDNPRKANVSIIGRSSGNVQINCTQGFELHQLMIRTAANIRAAEAEKLGITIPADQLTRKGELVANWFVPQDEDHTAVYNGSLANPTVDPTRLTLEKIHQIVCQTLGQAA